MAGKFKTMTFKMHGLPHDQNGAVRIDEFAQKITALVKGLESADKQANQKKSHDFLITDMRCGSAELVLTETQKSLKHFPEHSALEYMHEQITKIENHEPLAPQASLKVLEYIEKIAEIKGCGLTEITFGTNAPIILDQAFKDQLHREYERLKNTLTLELPLFEGTAFGSFRGRLEYFHRPRKSVPRYRLFPTIGEKEIKCISSHMSAEEILPYVTKLVCLHGRATYNGKSHFPTEIDITKIDPLKETPDLTRWQGAFDWDFPSNEDVY